VWGAVLEVAPRRLTVALPHGLRGTVNAEDASDVFAALMATAPSKSDRQLQAAVKQPPASLTDIFYPGQFVQCAVKSLEAAKEASDGTGKDTVRNLPNTLGTVLCKHSFYNTRVHLNSQAT
jgi:hypothetical protein